HRHRAGGVPRGQAEVDLGGGRGGPIGLRVGLGGHGLTGQVAEGDEDLGGAVRADGPGGVALALRVEVAGAEQREEHNSADHGLFQGQKLRCPASIRTSLSNW
ncbi:MAG: hypothetical protein ACK559_34635, partial [bacterium]